MCRKKLRGFLQVFGVIIALLFSMSFVHAQPPDDIISKEKAHPKIQSALEQLHKKNVSDGREILSIPITQEKITVFIMAEPGKTADTIDKAALESYGAEIIKSVGGVLKAKVPIDKITEIADNVKGVSFIQLPEEPLSHTITTQGVALTSATSFQLAGYKGAGVKVAVIDLGFVGLSAAISNGELPNNVTALDCATSASCISVSSPYDNLGTLTHGTAVAEIIYDMAPEAQLYLIKINDITDLNTAKDYCIANGIKIINHSVTWANSNFYDGKCWSDLNNPVCTLNDAYSAGILWVNCAGNLAKKHYSGTFSDTNSDNYHDQNISISAQAGDTIKVYLTWDAWQYTDQDYDLTLYDSSSTVLLASSTTRQTGTQRPTEYISYVVPSTGSYNAWIRKYSATANHKLELYSFSHDITPSVAIGSVTSPADAGLAITVGAIEYPYWTTGPIASYSSQGPTNGGVIKPDMTGPALVSTYTYNPYGFVGTSAASPHVAGAAALMLSKHPDYSVSQLTSALIADTIGMGSSGNDNIYGYGRLELSCTFTMAPSYYGFNDTAGTGTFGVTFSPIGCSGMAHTSDSWIDITKYTGSNGIYSIDYSVSANTTGRTRTGTITIGGQTFTVTQAAVTFTQAQLDQAVTDANTAKDLIIAEKDKSITSLNTTIAAMFTQTQLDKAVSDANAAKDLIITQKDASIASMFTKTEMDKAVTDANASKDLTIASMFTKAQLDQAVVEERIKWDINSDGKMGLAEVLYILQKVAGVR